MDWFTLTSDILLYASMSMMLCAEMRESLDTGTVGPLLQFFAYATI